MVETSGEIDETRAFPGPPGIAVEASPWAAVRRFRIEGDIFAAVLRGRFEPFEFGEVKSTIDRLRIAVGKNDVGGMDCDGDTVEDREAVEEGDIAGVDEEVQSMERSGRKKGSSPSSRLIVSAVALLTCSYPPSAVTRRRLGGRTSV
jgi:hypothetical protein